MPRVQRKTIAIAALAVALAAGAFWAWQGKPRAVTVVAAHVGPATELVYATGYVEAQQPVTISSRITAPVSRVLVSEGDAVHRGQPLVLLAADEQQAALAQAAAQQRAAEQTEGRTVTLFRQGWVTKAARDQAVANADAARAATAAARARQGQLVIRAESDGVVTRRDVYDGDLATPGKALLLLGDPLRIRVTATVDERDIARVRVGQPALMANDAYPGKAIPAHVAEVTPGGDPTARAFRVRLLPDAAAGTLPIGLSLEVNLVTRREARALLVPAKALAAGRVWTVEDGKARAHAVTTGIAGADAVQVTAGLAAGARVIVSPPADLREGERVKAVVQPDQPR
ncbi:MAG: efflux RND transporter periplasmic adaptor subunit [Sphingomonadales bacterium]|nr:efflux RND transporter periplasmic adaptor subunit [Sphingomonadales bacterium]